MNLEEHLDHFDNIDWGSNEFINYIGTLSEFKNNQYFRGLKLLLLRSPYFVNDDELWHEALPNAQVLHLDSAINKFFQDLRNRLKTAGLDQTVQPYQLKGFHGSIALDPLTDGENFLPQERENLIMTMTDDFAEKIARVVYPVVVSGPILRSHFEAKHFAIVNYLLNNPQKLIPYQILVKSRLTEPNIDMENLKDAIDHIFRGLGLATRLKRQDDMLGIKLQG